MCRHNPKSPTVADYRNAPRAIARLQTIPGTTGTSVVIKLPHVLDPDLPQQFRMVPCGGIARCECRRITTEKYRKIRKLARRFDDVMAMPLPNHPARSGHHRQGVGRMPCRLRRPYARLASKWFWKETSGPKSAARHGPGGFVVCRRVLGREVDPQSNLSVKPPITVRPRPGLAPSLRSLT